VGLIVLWGSGAAAAFAGGNAPRNQVSQAQRLRKIAMQGGGANQRFCFVQRQTRSLAEEGTERFDFSSGLDERPFASGSSGVIEDGAADQVHSGAAAHENEHRNVELAPKCVNIHHIEASHRNALQQHGSDVGPELATAHQLNHTLRYVATVPLHESRHNAVEPRARAHDAD
jgi:hypothetical protein